MDHSKIALFRNEIDKELEGVAARIRPLPDEVAPSAEFLSRTRLRLLQLPSAAGLRPAQRAA